MSISVRAARAGDEGLIWQFIRALAEYEKLTHLMEATKEDLGRDLFGKNARVFCEIAEIDGKPVGFALWYYSYSTFAGRHGIWLEDLFVAPDMRGRGIGKLLMAHLAKKCRDQGLTRFEWWVLNWNRPSIEFYQSLGAVIQDEWSVCRLDGQALQRLATQ